MHCSMSTMFWGFQWKHRHTHKPLIPKYTKPSRNKQLFAHRFILLISSSFSIELCHFVKNFNVFFCCYCCCRLQSLNLFDRKSCFIFQIFSPVTHFSVICILVHIFSLTLLLYFSFRLTACLDVKFKWRSSTGRLLMARFCMSERSSAISNSKLVFFVCLLHDIKLNEVKTNCLFVCCYCLKPVSGANSMPYYLMINSNTISKRTDCFFFKTERIN